jgi:hypothetical protein
MDNLRLLESHCLGTAESEQSFLNSVFVEFKVFEECLLSGTFAPIILLGRKGTGKTAILKIIDTQSPKIGARSLYLKPDDMPLLENVSSHTELSTLKRQAYNALVSAIACKIGSELKGNLGRKDKKLFDKAISEGHNKPDFIEVALKGLSSVGSLIAQVDFSKIVPEIQSKFTSKELQDAIASNNKLSDRLFYLLLDDIDQVASPNDPNQVNRIWAYLLAAKKLTESLPNFRTLITLRTEVWQMLSRDVHGQRDQVDHIRPSLKKIDPSDEQISKIIMRRLDYVKDELLNMPMNDSLTLFFEYGKVTLPTSNNEQRFWLDYLSKTSRGRPRDGIQHLALLAKLSRESKATKICQSIVDKASYQYSNDKFDDAVREYALECPELGEIIQSFSAIDFTSETETVRTFLEKLPSHVTPSIRGRQILHNNEESLFLLWKFLHEINFINPRMPDERAEKGYRHITYDDRPDFVSKLNWNNMQQVQWEIHPSFRSFLLQLKQDNKARTSGKRKILFQEIGPHKGKAK